MSQAVLSARLLARARYKAERQTEAETAGAGDVQLMVLVCLIVGLVHYGFILASAGFIVVLLWFRHGAIMVKSRYKCKYSREKNRAVCLLTG